MATNIHELSEEVFRIPVTSFKLKTGFGFDIGGSMAKVAYVKDVDGDMADVHLVSCPRDQVEKAVEFIQEKFGHITTQADVLYTCGVGGHEFKRLIKEKLQVSIDNISEFDCFVDAFKFLMETLPREDILHKPDQEVEEHRSAVYKEFQELQVALDSHDVQSKRYDDSVKQSTPSGGNGTEAEDYLPCTLMMAGSGCAVMKVEAGVSPEFVDRSNRAGRMFLGLGSMLTGCKSFDELIALAEKGRQDNVDTMMKHLKTGDSTDLYGAMPDSLLAYSFGQGMGKTLADFRKEDLARALLSTITRDLGHVAFNSALTKNISRVYICGGFPGLSPLVRQEMGKAMASKAFSRLGTVDHAFLKYGGYLGAIGVMFRNMGKVSSVA